MVERRWGRIVNIGSVNARAGRTNLVAYSTAKAGPPRPHPLPRTRNGSVREHHPRPAPCASGGPDQAPVRPPPWTARGLSRPWWRSSWLGNPSTSTAAGCCNETPTSKETDRNEGTGPRRPRHR
ncbi:SDR family NAD(P)-dependent oxidoreductase [Streptomyces sp. NPDC087297]|uniref:SDR family NAD(P)-dependent oxidoreductase n=1 Tax=Streptomyces sp. NPDC087297 TaxID=3365778 RepID=UPI00382EC433